MPLTSMTVFVALIELSKLEAGQPGENKNLQELLDGLTEMRKAFIASRRKKPGWWCGGGEYRDTVLLATIQTLTERSSLSALGAHFFVRMYIVPLIERVVAGRHDANCVRALREFVQVYEREWRQAESRGHFIRRFA